MDDTIMETLQIQLPTKLTRIIKQEIHSSEALSQVFVEALQLWLEQHQKKNKDEKARAIEALKKADLIMTPAMQHTLADAMIKKLPHKKMPTRAQVETSLAKLKTPLSTEINAMRGGH